MDASEAIKAIADWHPDAQQRQSWGETAFFLNPDGRLKRGVYFATLKERDGPNDRASHLDRPGKWRLNFGLPRGEFIARFGPPPARPAKGGVIGGPWAFTASAKLTPHPVYGWMCWVAIVSPARGQLEELHPLLELARQRAGEGLRARLQQAKGRSATP